MGASAGGLEAFSSLLNALPDDPGISIAFVQHLASKHASALPTLLAGATRLPVTQVIDGMVVEVNHVYVIPPNVQMELSEGTLRLAPRPDNRSQFTPIDVFFRSVAKEMQSSAVGVVLSGTASDDAADVADIKAAGGITLAQDPLTPRGLGHLVRCEAMI